MSPKNEVHRLSHLCIRYVFVKLTQALSDDEGSHYEQVTEYLHGTTYEVVQELLKNILNSVNLDAATRYSCLEVLLRQDVRKLDAGIFPHSYYKGILKVITEKGTGLRQLNLKGVWVRDHPLQLSALIRSLEKLRILIIPHMADDEVLDAITRCCSLTHLDISGECNFSGTGLRQLRNDTITVLDIGYFGKKDITPDCSGIELMAAIIEQLPNLTSVRTYSFTGSALLALARKNSGHSTKLKYLHDTGTTHEVFDAILLSAQNLESIHLDLPGKGVLPRLSELKSLNLVKLGHYETPDFFNYIEISGANLQVLKLNHNKQDILNLCDVSLFTPNLQTLECYHLNLAFTQPDIFFINLEYIELLYCKITDCSLRCLLLNAPFLKRVIIGSVINMSDGDIFRLCAECNFFYLEELWFSCAKGLTITAVELLMGHCPNLKVIGQLSGWDIHQEEIDYLRSVILYTNTNLTLLPLGTL